MFSDVRADADLLDRIRGEFLEMPGLHLTAPQARRLWSLDHETCERLLERLLASRFLCRTRHGAFRLSSSSSRA